MVFVVLVAERWERRDCWEQESAGFLSSPQGAPKLDVTYGMSDVQITLFTVALVVFGLGSADYDGHSFPRPPLPGSFADTPRTLSFPLAISLDNPNTTILFLSFLAPAFMITESISRLCAHNSPLLRPRLALATPHIPRSRGEPIISSPALYNLVLRSIFKNLTQIPTRGRHTRAQRFACAVEELLRGRTAFHQPCDAAVPCPVLLPLLLL